MKVFIFQSDCRLYVDLDTLMWLKHERERERVRAMKKNHYKVKAYHQ